MEEEIVPSDTPTDEVTTPEVEVGLPADPVEVEPVDEDVQANEVLKQRNQELYEQLKKAKGFIRDKDGKWVKKDIPQVPKQENPAIAGITTEELFGLVKANVADEDMGECKIFARSHGMTINEALKDDRLKAVLKVNTEYRKSAEASNMSKSRVGQIKPTHDQILENASKGVIEDIDAVVKARMAKKLESLQK